MHLPFPGVLLKSTFLTHPKYKRKRKHSRVGCLKIISLQCTRSGVVVQPPKPLQNVGLQRGVHSRPVGHTLILWWCVCRGGVGWKRKIQKNKNAEGQGERKEHLWSFLRVSPPKRQGCDLSNAQAHSRSESTDHTHNQHTPHNANSHRTNAPHCSLLLPCTPLGTPCAHSPQAYTDGRRRCCR